MSNGHPWLPQHTELLIRMNDVGCTDREIATATDHAAITVFYRRTMLGLPSGRGRNVPPRKRLQFKYKIGACS